MEATSPSPLLRWLGYTEFEALARGACAAPEDDAPRLVLADWLRDRGDDAAADEVQAAGPMLRGWLAIAYYEREVGRPPPPSMSHLTELFHRGSYSTALDGALASARRAAVGLIERRANDERSVT